MPRLLVLAFIYYAFISPLPINTAIFDHSHTLLSLVATLELLDQALRMGNTKGGIPAWQRKDSEDRESGNVESQEDSESERTTSNDSKPHRPESASEAESSKPALDATHSTHEPPHDQMTLLQHASKFLQDPQVRDASPDEKRAFLRSKGLSEASIEQKEPLLQPTKLSQSTPNPPAGPLRPHPVSPPSMHASPPRSADAPPIITYPEHLLQPQKPPPLITTTRLLNTTYIFAGFAATFYGLSNYLVKPMTESLSASRHDFHSHTQSKLNELAKRLEGTVSEDPALAASRSSGGGLKDVDEAIDTASDDSDPTELFHRDFGTQTSPEDLPTASSKSDDEPTTIAEVHQRQLDRLRIATAELSSDSVSLESQTIHELRTWADMLRNQLEGLAFPASADGGSFRWGSGGSGFSNIYGSAAKKDSDEVSKMKQEIRSLKGSLLSARSFPAGNGSRKTLSSGLAGGVGSE